MVDGIDGEVINSLVEDNPEDWSALEPQTKRADLTEQPNLTEQQV